MADNFSLGNDKQVVIIGAGLTGLTTAFYLKRFGFDVVVLDSLSQAGGVIKTINDKGFTIECGPNTGVLGNVETYQLFADLEGACELEKANPLAKSRWIWKGKRWEKLPSGPISFFKTSLFSLRDKLGLLAEPFRKKGTDPNETLDKMVLRRLGKSFLDYAIDPFIAGVYAGNVNYLVPRFALPKLYDLEQAYGSFILGAIKKGRLPKTELEKKVTKEVISAKGGLGVLVHNLVQSIGEASFTFDVNDLVVEKKVATNNRTFYNLQGTVNGKVVTFNSQYVITTTGAHALPKLIPFVGNQLLKPIGDLLYAKVVLVTLGFEKWQGIPINAFGGLVPSIEKRQILGVLFTSSFFANRAPQGGALLSVFLGGLRQPHLTDYSDEQILSIVEQEVRQTLGVNDYNPNVVHVFRYNNAIPQYGASTAERLSAVRIIEKENQGLIIAGNLRDGIGMADRMKQGHDIAQRISTLNA